ncbi:MAG TPA: FG-GAP-like repeat-containing protein [Dermatophilaceae bacterium]|nr:FG-GAP-like repeat-containing protein [Dermatophilaceae bacterium]
MAIAPLHPRRPRARVLAGGTLLLVVVGTAVPGAPARAAAPGAPARAVSAPGVSAPALAPGAVAPTRMDRLPFTPVAGAGPASDLAGSAPSRRPGIRVLASAPERDVTDMVAVLGVTWPGRAEPGTAYQARTRTSGRWSAWRTLATDAEHGPDAGSAEARRGRGGTEPLVVTGAERVQVRALGTAKLTPGAAVDLLEPGSAAAPVPSPAPSPAPSPVAPSSAAPSPAPSLAARPTIYTRAQWGADESMRDHAGPWYSQVQMAFVHHTVSTNSYSPSQVPAMIRGIYAYHVRGRGWTDIGYNFLVDRFGRAWEGRYGGMDRAVIGAQVAGLNSWSTGISAIGDFDIAQPPSAVAGAIERVLAWKLGVHGIPAIGRVSAAGMVFNRINGHRDGGQTACPGRYLYAQLPAIRAAVAHAEGSLPRARVDRDLDHAFGADLLSYPGNALPARLTGSVTSVLAGSRQPVVAGAPLGTGWEGVTHPALTRDLTGDGRADVVAVDPLRGRLRIYAGDGAGRIASVRANGAGWDTIADLIPAGDRDGDGRNDLLAVDAHQQLLLYRGDGAGWLRPGRVIGHGWGALSSVADAGDLDGDGRRDLLAVRRSDGALLVYRGLADGGVASGVVWAHGWDAFTAVAAADLDGDRHPDVLARERGGRMRAYYSSGAGSLLRVNYWGSGWQAGHDLSSGADFDGDGSPDLLAVFPGGGGTLRLYAGTGVRDFMASAPAPQRTVAGADLVRVVGDVDGDGYADAVARITTDDTLAFLRGTRSGGLGNPVTIGHGWSIFDVVEPGGDWDYDGVPDIVARTVDGVLYAYPMTRGTTPGFKSRIELEDGMGGFRDFAGVGAFNADSNGDLMALRDDGALLLYRGSGPTPLNDAFLLASGQTDLVRIMGTGDFNGDGLSDLLAQATSGALWLYGGDGNGRFAGPRQPVAGAPGGSNVMG